MSQPSYLFMYAPTCFITAVVYLHGQRWQMIKISKERATHTHIHTLPYFTLSLISRFIRPSLILSFPPWSPLFSLSSISFSPTLFHPPFSHFHCNLSRSSLFLPPWETKEAITRAVRGSVCVTCAGVCVCVYKMCPPIKPLKPRPGVQA